VPFYALEIATPIRLALRDIPAAQPVVLSHRA